MVMVLLKIDRLVVRTQAAFYQFYVVRKTQNMANSNHWMPDASALPRSGIIKVYLKKKKN